MPNILTYLTPVIKKKEHVVPVFIGLFFAMYIMLYLIKPQFVMKSSVDPIATKHKSFIKLAAFAIVLATLLTLLIGSIP